MRILNVLLLSLPAAACVGEAWTVAEGTQCAVWNPSPELNGTVTWTGSCVDGKAHGEGALVWKFMVDSEHVTEQYEGGLERGKPEGWGRYTHSMGEVYEGGWKDGKRHGYGVDSWSNGGRYEGTFRNGLRHGYGSEVFPSGSMYEGNFVDGSATGFGVLTSSKGFRYRGQFQKHKFHGRGECTLLDSGITETCCYNMDKQVECEPGQ